MTSPLNQLKRVFVPLVFFSAITNLAILVNPIFMMQVLDRVVPSQNLNTLTLLLLIALGFIALQAGIEYIRDNTFQRAARWTEKVALSQILLRHDANQQDNIDDLAMVSSSLSGGTALSILNLPWLPIFAITLWIINPIFLGLAAAILSVQFAIKGLAHFLTKEKERQRGTLQNLERKSLANSADFFAASGMHSLSRNLIARYAKFQTQRHDIDDALTPWSGFQASSTTFLRTATQLLGLSVGATLVVWGELTAGGMIAASIILAKSTVTCETTLTAIPNMKMAWASFQSLNSSLQKAATHQTTVADLSGELTAENLIIPRGRGAPPRLDRVSLKLNAGECLAIIGASGSGKSSLLNALAGVNPAPIGSVLLDQSEVKSISAETAAMHIGYLPQQAQLFDGTLAENICGFDLNPNDARIIEVAKIAGVHGLISALPKSYETDMGQDPFLLSAGQKQRIALARAIYNAPKYLFLDEPNALLDAEGERQMGDALARLRSQGTTIVMVIHRSGVMGLADKVLHLDNGRVTDFGSRAEVLARFNVGVRRFETPLVPSSLQDVTDWVARQFVRRGDEPFREKAVLIATELFNVAIHNGPKENSRRGVFEFNFLDDYNCEISLTEAEKTKADKKMDQVRSLVARPDTIMEKLPKDELSLAILQQVSTDLCIRNVEGGALFHAAISHNQPVHLNARAQH